MQFLSKGGYAEVFYDTDRKEVLRRSPRTLASSRQLDVTSFNDLVFTKSLEYTSCTPSIHAVEISKEHISFRMPYYGVPLYKWVEQNTIETRRRHAAYIIAQLVTGCMYFENNAFMHTDIKPSNIMIETVYSDAGATGAGPVGAGGAEGVEWPGGAGVVGSKKEIVDIIVRIIDFNSTSVKITTAKDADADAEWANAVGTWNYCAPEITLYDRPYNNSASWSIGIVAAYIIDRYPLVDLITKEMDRTLVGQDVWCDFIQEWYKKYEDHVPLMRSGWYDENWKELVWNCTHWSSSKRWALSRIYRHVYTELMTEETRAMPRLIHPDDLHTIVPLQKHIPVGRVCAEDRSWAIGSMLDLCGRMEILHVFPTAVAIFDRGVSMIEDRLLASTRQVAAAAFMLACFVNNFAVVASSNHMIALVNAFQCISRAQVLTYVYHIGNMLQWKLWEKPVHVIVTEKEPGARKNAGLFDHIRDALLVQDDVYTQAGVADWVIDRLRAHGSNLV